MKKRFSIDKYVKGILDGNRIILSQAITLVESSKAEDIKLSQQLIKEITPFAGKSKRIGITGVPGVGKSTFIEAFGKILISKGFKIAVLTIDPTSQKTKGSILGDKTRMDELSINPNAYIRPSAAGNSLGGVAHKTRETILLCEAAGYDIVFIETVGVGQSEIAVKNMTDMFILLMLAGAGDELQGIKRGIMEMADIIAITKSDGANKQNAQNAKIEYQNAIHFFQANENGFVTEVLTCSSTEVEGIEEIWDSTQSYFNTINTSHFLEINRSNQTQHWFKELINERLLNSFYNNENIKEALPIMYEKIKISPNSISLLVDEVFNTYSK